MQHSIPRSLVRRPVTWIGAGILFGAVLLGYLSGGPAMAASHSRGPAVTPAATSTARTGASIGNPGPGMPTPIPTGTPHVSSSIGNPGPGLPTTGGGSGAAPSPELPLALLGLALAAAGLGISRARRR